MSRDPLASSNNDAENTDAEPALTDAELSVVVGGTSHTCAHGSTTAHSYEKHGKQKHCPGPGGNGGAG